MLLDEIVEAMDLESWSPRSRTIITLRPLRNLSKAGHDEAAAVTERFLQLVATPADVRGLQITDEQPAAAEYTLSGTVYLIEHSSREYWEVWLALKPVDANWSLWRNEKPVRLLRRPGSRDSLMFGDTGPERTGRWPF